MFAELNPSGRAGSDERKLSAALNSVEKLICFFDDGEVGRKVGVKHAVKSEAAKCCNHLALNICSNGHTEALTESCTDGRSGVNNNLLGRIVKSLPNLIGVVLLIERTNRAGYDTLTAGDTCNFIKILIKCASDM